MPDATLRDLERAASLGDLAAAERLESARARLVTPLDRFERSIEKLLGRVNHSWIRGAHRLTVERVARVVERALTPGLAWDGRDVLAWDSLDTPGDTLRGPGERRLVVASRDHRDGIVVGLACVTVVGLLGRAARTPRGSIADTWRGLAAAVWAELREICPNHLTAAGSAPYAAFPPGSLFHAREWATRTRGLKVVRTRVAVAQEWLEARTLEASQAKRP